MTNPWHHNVSANVLKPKPEYEDSKERSGTGEEPPRPEQTDITISREDSSSSPVSIFHYLEMLMFV